MKDWSTIRERALYSFGQIGSGAYNGLNNAVLGLYISGFTSNPFIIGYIGNTRSVEGVVIQPLIGRWSDRTTSRLGRRRPFILAAIPIATLAVVLMPIFGHLRHGFALPLVVAASVLFSLFWNVASDPYSSLMVDITPERERSVFNAILSMISLLAQVGITLFASAVARKKNDIPDSIFYLCAAVILVTYAVVFFGVREPARAAEVARKEERLPWRTYVTDLRRFTEAFKLLVSVFFFWTGLNAFIPYITVFPIHTVGASKSQSLLVYVALILSAALCTYPFGLLAKRHGNRRYIVIGTLLLIAAAIIGLVVHTLALLFPLGVLAGAGFAATTALTYPYLSELVPGSKIGTFTGLQTAFSAVCVPISVGVTGTLIDHFGWRSIFVMLAVMMAVDVLVLLRVDEGRAKAQVREVNEAEAVTAAI